MNVNCFRISKGAVFYRKLRPITQEEIECSVFNICPATMGDVVFSTFRDDNLSNGAGLFYSLVVFKYSKEPGFLRGSDFIEQRFGYVLIVENDDYMMISKNGASSIKGQLKDAVSQIDHERLKYFKVKDVNAYPVLSYANMSTSDRAIRQGRVEAFDCSEAFPIINVNRKSVKSYKAETVDGNFSISTKSSSIRQMGGGASLREVVSWSGKIMGDLDEAYVEEGFFSNFAQGIVFKDLPSDVVPNGLLIDLSTLQFNVSKEEEPWRLFRKDAKEELIPLSISESEKLLIQLKQVFRLIVDDRGRYVANVEWNGKKYVLCALKKGDRGYRFISYFMKKYFVEQCLSGPISIASYVVREKCFSVSYNDPGFYYFRGQLLKDPSVQSLVDRIMSIFVSYDLNGVVSEKGKIDKRSKGFPRGSLFYFVENELFDLSDPDLFLACDDLGDEWADYIGFNKNPQKACLRFVHAKHKGETSTGASNFHDVVGQALKNLGRVNINLNDFQEKLSRWSTPYSKSNIDKKRTLWDDDQAVAGFKSILDLPYTKREVYIVASFVSRKDVEHSFELLRQKKAPHHVTQLAWILISFISECQSVGALPYIICKE